MPVDPDFDAIAGALAREPDVVALTGYFGDGPDGKVRLYFDPELKVWIDIPEDEVVHRFRRPGENEKFGEYSVLWVRGEFMRSKTVSDEVRANLAEGFLFGEFALDLLLPPTILHATDRVAYLARATTMHTRHCPP